MPPRSVNGGTRGVTAGVGELNPCGATDTSQCTILGTGSAVMLCNMFVMPYNTKKTCWGLLRAGQRDVPHPRQAGETLPIEKHFLLVWPTKHYYTGWLLFLGRPRGSVTWGITCMPIFSVILIWIQCSCPNVSDSCLQISRRWMPRVNIS